MSFVVKNRDEDAETGYKAGQLDQRKKRGHHDAPIGQGKEEAEPVREDHEKIHQPQKRKDIISNLHFARLKRDCLNYVESGFCNRAGFLNSHHWSWMVEYAEVETPSNLSTVSCNAVTPFSVA